MLLCSFDKKLSKNSKIRIVQHEASTPESGTEGSTVVIGGNPNHLDGSVGLRKDPC